LIAVQNAHIIYEWTGQWTVLDSGNCREVDYC